MNARFPRYKKSKQERGKKKRDDWEHYNLCLTISMAVLADRFGFEEEDLQAFMDDYNTLVDSMFVDNDNIKQMQKALKEIHNIEVVES